MNKETAGADLGLTLQTGFVTKALVGLFGSDRFRLAVSADGSTFFDGLSVDNATGIVDQPRLPRFKAYTNYDNYVGVGTWTKIGLNNTDYNDQGAFDAANNHFVAPVDGTYLFGATLLYKINASATARMRGRLVLNGTTEIRGSLGEISATHVSLATAIWLQTLVPLTAGDTVELQGYFDVVGFQSLGGVNGLEGDLQPPEASPQIPQVGLDEAVTAEKQHRRRLSLRCRSG
jgi:hypothetical protein